MGYQAVLFCPDEKLARVVSQVFDEVDFVIDPVNDPFLTVKKLMAQRYDAIVIDCVDQQNSSMLFKSAHNSPFNQNSLAIALVEGQAGVAQAYRIGANLVLTKPINVEQAKGTLRVARGLLRKNADATATAAASAMTRGVLVKDVPAAFTPSVKSGAHDTPAATPPIHGGGSGFAAPFTVVSGATVPPAAMNAAAKTAELPAVALPSPQVAALPATGKAAQSEPPVWADATESEVAKSELSKPAEAPAPVLTAATREAGAAAPAPAKEAARPVEIKPAKKEAGLDAPPDAKKLESTGAEEVLSYKESVSDGLSFAAFREQDEEGPQGSKKILIVAGVFLTLVVVAYFGWSTFGGSHSGAPPRPAPALEQQPTAPTSNLAPMPLPTPAPSAAGKVSRPSASLPSSVPKNSQPQNGKRPSSTSSEDVAVGSEAKVKEPEPEPIHVKADTTAIKPAPQAEAIVPPPSLLAVGQPDSANLSGLVRSEANVPKPTLAQTRVSQGVSQGLLIKQVQPKYPSEALASHAQGAVLIEATIDKEGSVVNPKVLSGNRALAKAALEAVKQWRYKPYYLNGEPVEIQTQITINFKSN